MIIIIIIKENKWWLRPIWHLCVIKTLLTCLHNFHNLSLSKQYCLELLSNFYLFHFVLIWEKIFSTNKFLKKLVFIYRIFIIFIIWWEISKSDWFNFLIYNNIYFAKLSRTKNKKNMYPIFFTLLYNNICYKWMVRSIDLWHLSCILFIFLASL